eukprot:TRINITY_DN79597_c0_g1_i1.p2 TRINITY_DN79597_c0_g1~~TRINITY_DN79597_c0_g1_i1.p2  ORF type:complete len:181 (+),score=36.58 TRINITY_DN79597_c0_g1_i1:82-624(+)
MKRSSVEMLELQAGEEEELELEVEEEEEEAPRPAKITQAEMKKRLKFASDCEMKVLILSLTKRYSKDNELIDFKPQRLPQALSKKDLQCCWYCDDEKPAAELKKSDDMKICVSCHETLSHRGLTREDFASRFGFSTSEAMKLNPKRGTNGYYRSVCYIFQYNKIVQGLKQKYGSISNYKL